MHSLARQRFEIFWSQVAPSYSGQKVAIIGSDRPQNFNCLQNKDLCHFISNVKDILREAKSLGFVISTILQQYYDIIILELTKSKETNLGLIALAEEYIKDKGQVIINGDNHIGVKSFLKKISSHWPAEKTVVKKKGRIAIYQKKKKYLATGKNIKIFIKIEMAITPDAICFLQRR